MDDRTHLTRCPRCGTKLPADTHGSSCPVCLFPVAVGPASTLTGETLPALPVSRATPQQPPGPTPGRSFGPYRIERLLGRGGMGDVYEAEQLEQGRRVALKVLNRPLVGPEDRARFLREGQLAASINHPHSVYIFGSEEIAGTATIVMELLPGGTLKDRVKEHGPLPPAEAVDAILQVIAGLDAMHATGVLHRDIKPSNCFIDRDGTVKVGDFGLSISTTVHDVTQLTVTGAFLGTPQFAAPEQLKGEPLDVRADIYAVGATLYYLLTGQPAFAEANLLALVTRIATDVPRSPRALAPAVPRGLATIVLRCLAKDRAQRPATYAALHEALQPFSSVAPTPATIRLRLDAGAIDAFIVGVPLLLLNNFVILTEYRLSTPWWLFILPNAMWCAYYGIAEGLSGAAVGKRLVGLRVVIASGGQPPGVTRASWRALLFYAPFVVYSLRGFFLGQTRMLQLYAEVPLLTTWAIVGSWVAIALMFSTARRRNGFAAVHDLWSGTRVVHRVKDDARQTIEAALAPAGAVDASPRRVGPFDVIGTLGRTDTGTLVLGFDSRLRRRVWIHELPSDTPSVAPTVRDLNRRGRLRWLGGRRTSTESWDAYEALDGAPLVILLDRPWPWRLVRRWLADLAREIDAALQDGSLTRLALDYLWITSQGRVKLLDFRVPVAPVASAPTSPASAESAQTFLSEVATRALTGHPSGDSTAVDRRHRRMLPLSASALLDALDRRALATWSEVVRRTTGLMNGPVHVDRWRRAASLVLAAAPAVGPVLMIAVMGSTVSATITPEIQELSNALNVVSRLHSGDGVSTLRSGEGAIDRTALETYIAGRFGATMTDQRVWANPFTAGYLRPHRQLVERIVADHPRVSAEQMAAATAVLGPFLRRQASIRGSSRSMNPGTPPFWVAPFFFSQMAIVAIVSAWLFRGGFVLRAFDIAVVTRNGEPASRLHALWRALIAWGPVLVLVPLSFKALSTPWLVMPVGIRLSVGLWAMFLAGATWAIVHPERGLQDRIAGTYLVPR